MIFQDVIERLDDREQFSCGQSFMVLPSMKSRSCRPELLFFLRNLAKFTGKPLRQSLFLNKVASLRPETLLKRDSGTSVLL